MSDLARRLAGAAVAVPLLVWLVFTSNPYPYAVVISLLGLAGLREAFALLQRSKLDPFAGLGYAAAVLIFLAAGAESAGPLLPESALATTAIVSALVIGAALHQLAGGVTPGGIRDAGATVFAVFYVAWLSAYLIRLRGLPDGSQWVFLTLVLTWVFDTAAYGWGRAMGVAKLWKNVSPAKTWAGVWGGMATTAVLVGLFQWLLETVPGAPLLFPASVAPWHLVAFAPLAGAAATLGDLVESLMKRAARVKDSGTFLPGHGGVLDKLDAFLFTAPLIYYFALLVS